jgi:hypothetical protein
MKLISRIASAVALTAGLFATSAGAAEICNNCSYNGNTYLGAHNANTFDTSGFRHNGITVGAPVAFSDVWVFDLSPVGAVAQINANFIPISPSAFTNFNIDLRFVTSAPGCGAVGANCGATVLGGIISSSSNAGANSNLFPVALAAGRYAFVISGIANALGGPAAQYSGQLSTSKIPEPGSLALVGVALLGAAFGLRGKRKA